MKYEVIMEAKNYALIKRGIDLEEYAVVSRLDIYDDEEKIIDELIPLGYSESEIVEMLEYDFAIDMSWNKCVDEDMLSGFLEEENVSLEEYLTNRKYVVIQDGDEYCYWDDIKNTGLIDMDAIDYEYVSLCRLE